MNKEQWVEYLNTFPNKLELLQKYCKDKEKSNEDIIKFLDAVIATNSINYYSNIALELICIEHSIAELWDENNNLLTYLTY